MRNCENKLMLFEQKLEKVNAAMVLLESKVSTFIYLHITIFYYYVPNSVKYIFANHLRNYFLLKM